MNLIELHILQSFPVSCLNRDDVGAPKTARFGGCQRARISSQCWKRAIRTLAKESEAELFAGQRTRFVVRALEELYLANDTAPEEARVLASLTADALGKLDDLEKGNVKTLLYFSPQELGSVVANMLEQDYSALLAAVVSDPGSDKKAGKEKEKAGKDLSKLAEKAAKALKNKVKDTADIAIFGRMVADDHSLMLEGAGLFSHILSTHSATNEIDFFSAVDDQNMDDSGAGHIGTIEFNSACYYRYIGLNLDLLKDADHLGHFDEQELRAVVETFLRSAIMSVPAARKNSMFGFNPPAYVLGLTRMGQPLSLVNAFETPVRSSQGYIEESTQAMMRHWEALTETYCLRDQVVTEAILPESNLNDFIAQLTAEL
ncbi:MAG: type I-E CRISPR-associated protein Cas7/Cse4/CasC [Lentisphaeria bacterium]|nr:type I-E CRISPR-associated protein Cas7/Cse4/CasC [Lentisphaeria bacterium]